MKPLSNIRLFENRIKAIAKKPPANKLKGLGNKRVECKLPYVFNFLTKWAPEHCAIVVSRESINHFGKLGFVGHSYVSPEIASAITANETDLTQINTAANVLMNANLWLK